MLFGVGDGAPPYLSHLLKILFFLQACEECINNRLTISTITQISLPSLAILKQFHAQPIASSDKSTEWKALKSLRDDILVFPATMNTLSISPKGRYLALGYTADRTNTEHPLFVMDLKKLSMRYAELPAPAQQMAFNPEESAFFAVTKAKKGYGLDIAKLHLSQASSLDPSAKEEGYQVDGLLRLNSTTYGTSGVPSNLAISPDSRRLVIDGCDNIDWSNRTCNGKLFVIDADSMTLERSLNALGPAAFTPDGSVLIGWSDPSSENKQISLPLPFDYTAETPKRGGLSLFDTNTWENTKVEASIYGPLFFVTPKGNFVVTVSDSSEQKLIISDLDNNKSTIVGKSLSLVEFSVSTDGTNVYTVEQGGLKKLDLKAATISQIIPAGQGIEKIKADLQGTSMKPRSMRWTRVEQQKEPHTDAIFISRLGRQYFEIWSNTATRLFQRKNDFSIQSP